MANKKNNWKIWYIKIIHSYGNPEIIGLTIKARNKDEAENKAAKIVKGKCSGFAVFCAP